MKPIHRRYSYALAPVAAAAMLARATVFADCPCPDFAAGPLSSPPETPAWIQAIYFYQPGCPSCIQVEQWLDMLAVHLGEVSIRRLNVRNPSAMELHEALSARWAIPERQHLVAPAIFTARGALVGDQITFESLARLLVESAGIPMEGWSDGWTSAPAAANSIKERFRRFAAPTVMLFGLWDGFNPCAFATMIFFVSYLQMGHRSRREMWRLGLSFIAAVFIVYLLLGMGLLNILTRWHFLSQARLLLNGLLGLLALVVGLLSLYDAYRARQGNLGRWARRLPDSFRDGLHRIVREGMGRRHPATAACASGVAVSVIELACTGQTYLPTIAYMIEVGQQRRTALAWMALYNIMFVAPLLVLLILGIYGLRHPSALAWMRRHAVAVKIGAALICFLIAGVLLQEWFALGFGLRARHPMVR